MGVCVVRGAMRVLIVVRVRMVRVVLSRLVMPSRGYSSRRGGGRRVVESRGGRCLVTETLMAMSLRSELIEEDTALSPSAVGSREAL